MELKPCPFCGGKAKIQLWWPAAQKANKKTIFIMCKSCGCKTQTVYQVPYMAWDDCKRYAIEAWNRRANDV